MVIESFPAGQTMFPGVKSVSKNNARLHAYDRAIRLEALRVYGGDPPRCACCGENRTDFLVIDHPDKDGAEFRRNNARYRSKIHRWARLQGWPAGLRVLCHNCNYALGLLHQCPHELERSPVSPILFTKTDSRAILPVKMHPSDAGYDIYTLTRTEIPIGEVVDIPTGINIALPPGTWGEIAGRSSAFRKKGLMVTPGVIDGGWRGDLVVGVWNMHRINKTLDRGERIAQFLLHPMIEAVWEETDTLPIGDRGNAGFGSTGR